MLPQRLVTGHTGQLPCLTGSEEDGMDEGECPQSLLLFTYIERSPVPVLVDAKGVEIRDNVCSLCPSARFGMEMVTFSSKILHNLLVKRGGLWGLPLGSSLTAIFDSCNSGTLLGNASSMHVRHLPLLIPRKTSTIISATTYIARGSAREGVAAKPSKTTSVSRRRAFTICHCPIPLSFHTVRKNCKGTYSGPPSRRGSADKEGDSETTAHFPSLLQLMETMDVCLTTTPTPLVEEPDRHYGKRCASPEHRFKCDGWCRTTIPRSSMLEHPDVVR
jgi:hypothetical protein